MTAHGLHCAENSRKAGYAADSSTGFRLLQNLFMEDVTMYRKLLSKRNVLLSSLCLFLLAAMTVVLASRGALADEGMPIKGTFTVAYSGTPNTAGVSFCGGTPLDVAVEAHGSGYSTLGPLSFSLHKTVQATGPLMHGCLILTAPNGDTLSAIYDGTEGAPNANNFGSGTIALTFSGGTGRFRDARGSANMTAFFSNFYPASSFAGGTAAPLQGVALYSVEGTVSLPQGDQ
jgi:hypothetical protein